MRLKTKARIKRASQAARNNATIVDAQALSDLTDLYSRSLSDINNILLDRSDNIGMLRLEQLNNVKRDVERVLEELSRLEKTALFERMNQVAELGVKPVAEQLGARRVSQMINSSVKASADFYAADGLQLSDRLWKVKAHRNEVVQQAVQSAIIQGKSASDAARDFVQRGQSVPSAIARNINGANASAVSRVVAGSLVHADSSPYKNSLRVFRTEINRAHITAYQQSVAEIDSAIGTRFLLSPHHPEVDICDLHARANLHGLGPGVYPHGKSPLPAHPNTISYEEVVFEDEVTDDDKEGKTGILDWLKTQPENIQRGVLGGRKKQQAFAAGVLSQGEISTPWSVLKRRYINRQINVDTFAALPTTIVPRPVISASDSNPFLSRPNIVPFKRLAAANAALEGFAHRVDFTGLPLAQLNSVVSGLDKVLGRYGATVGELRWLGRSESRGAAGVYAYQRLGWRAGTDRLSFRKGYVNVDYKKDGVKHQAYLARRERNIALLQSRIDEAPSERVRLHNEKVLTAIKRATRWSHGSIASDSIFSVVTHEAGHAIYFQGKDVAHKWNRRLQVNNVTKNDWYAVSEYAATDSEELFAEVTAFMAAGQENLLPANIVKAYIETLRDYARIE